MKLKSLLDNPAKLPTIPKVAQSLIASFSSEDVTVEDIARQLAADPALSAKLLRLANSAYFHVSHTVGTVDDALRMLGFVMVRNLVLGNSMVGAFRNTPGIDLKQFWRYNLYTACAARWLANTAGVNGDMVFTLGLMHALGQLQMHLGMPDDVAPLDAQMSVLAHGRAELEQRSVGFHYADVSAELVRMWNFPPAFVVALQNIPQPLASKEFSEPAGWVHLGAWRARCEVLGLEPDAIQASYPRAVGERLELDPAWASELAHPDARKVPHVMPSLKELTEGLEAMIG